MHLALRIGAFPVAPIRSVTKQSFPSTTLRILSQSIERMLDQPMNSLTGFVTLDTLANKHPVTNDLRLGRIKQPQDDSCLLEIPFALL
jgi:hypothetical protein